MEDYRRKSHVELLNQFSRHDIYVVGAGRSVDFIDKSFFDGKISIGVNSIWKYIPVIFCLFKHGQFIEEAINAKKTTVIMSKHECGDIDKELNNYNAHYIFTHKRGRFGDIEKNFEENINAIGEDDDIFVSHSSITSAIHLAAYMGAKNIIICGHDCGYIDGKSHIDSYDNHINEFYERESVKNDYYNQWFKDISNETMKLKKRLQEVYGCNIVSINPFVNFRLEGHSYDTAK